MDGHQVVLHFGAGRPAQHGILWLQLHLKLVGKPPKQIVRNFIHELVNETGTATQEGQESARPRKTSRELEQEGCAANGSEGSVRN